MNKKQVVSELQESVGDVLRNLTAIKGEAYANTVMFAHMGLHFARLMQQVSAMNDIPEPQVTVLFRQHAQLMETGISGLSNAYGMSQQTLDEILEWASKLDDKIDQAMEQLSQEN